MMRQKYTFLLTGFLLIIFTACEQDNKAYCSCLEQANKVNELSAVIWSGGATQQDTLALKKALATKDKLCQSIHRRRNWSNWPKTKATFRKQGAYRIGAHTPAESKP
jgi:hypothetical protein